MTSLYLNSCPSSFPVPDLNQEQNLPHHLFSNSFLINNTTQQFQTEFLPNFADLHHDQEVVDYISESRLRDPKPSSSSFQEAINQSRESPKRDEDEGIMNNSRGMEGSAKWIPSKMRIMQKMINSNASSEDNHHKPFKYTLRFQDHHTNYNESNNSSSQSIRVCSDCNTTTTPLWRSGPKGPKSLCNACGIRQRKARRAMAAAEAAVGNGTGVAAETKPSNKVHNMKEKKLRTAHVTHCKKLCKSPPPPHHHHHHPSLPPHKPKISFKNFAFNLSNTNNSALHPVFPQDVEQAAILLMELSCGFVHV